MTSPTPPRSHRRQFRPAILSITSIAATILWALLLALVGGTFAPLASAASYRWKEVPIHGGGFVTGIEFHPTEPGLLYARTDVAGAFRYDAANSRWIALNEAIGGLDNAFMELGIASLALDPQDPDRVYLACGQYIAWWAPDATVLRSTDRGATWQRTTLPFNLDGNSDGRNTGENLVVDPNLGSVLLLGTPDAGLWRSTDHGATFTQLSSFPAGNVTWVLFDRRSGSTGSATQTIYAGLAVAGTDAPSVFRSTDAGATWSALPGQPTALPLNSGDTASPQPIPQQAAFAYDATGRIFITYGNALGPNGVGAGSVWRYDTTSGAWDNVTPAPAPPAQQGGFSGVSVSAQNPSVITVSTLGRWWPGDEIYRSTDGGATWSTRLRSGTRDHSSAPWAASLNPHWIGDVEIDPANADRALFVTGYGIFQTLNFSASAPTWAFHNAGLEETAPLGLVSPSSGPDLVSVIGDFDGFRHDDVTSPVPGTRHTPSHGTTPSLGAATLEPNIMARTFYGSAGAPRGAYTTDGAATWTDFAASPSTAEGVGPGRIAVNADGTRFVWIQPDRLPHLSTNFGASWTPATGSVPAGSHTPVADPVAPLRFYVYDSGTGVLHRSTDGGVSFSTAATGLPTGASPPVPALGREGDLWLPASSGGLRRSTDAGSTFSTVSSVQRAYRLGFGRAADGASYPAIYLWGRVGGIDALWRSIDAAQTWERINDDDHNFGGINVIIGDPRRFGRVYIGSWGIRYGEPDDTPPPVLTLPEGWTGRDIGGPALVGAAGETDGTFTLRGSGWDIWGAWDQFHYASRVVHGDAGIVARVSSLTNTDTWAKAGLMFRAGLAADAPFVALFQRPDRQVTFQWRTATGANAELTAGSGLFGNTTDLKWLRLQRSGDTFSAAYSSDGTAWTTIATTPTIVLPSSAELGLALTAHNGNVLGTATFSNVVLTPEPLAITTATTLPGASAGLAYTTTLAARGGFPGYAWTLDTGTLPPGLALDPETGLLGGTPEAAGAFSFTVRATDADGATATRGFTLAVQGLPYASWLSGYFTPSEQADPLLGGSISADPDADTLPNLVEWALGRDPRTPDAAGALDFAVTPGAAPDTMDFVVTFTRRRAAPGVAWAVETTSDLAAPAWSILPEGDPSWTVDDDAGGLTQTITVRIPMTTARVFARLRLTQD